MKQEVLSDTKTPVGKVRLTPILAKGDKASLKRNNKRTQKEEMELRMYRAQEIVLETHLPSTF